MPVAFHASSTGAGDGVSGNTTTITKPTVSAGDILICTIGVNEATTAGTSTKVRIYNWWSLQSNSTLGFVYTAGTGSSNISWQCLSFSGVDNVNPIDVAGTGNSNTGASTISVTTFNTITEAALEVFGICDWNGGSSFTNSSFNFVLTSNSTNCQSATGYAKTATSPGGATGAFTITDGAASSGNILCFQQWALRPQENPEARGKPYGLSGGRQMQQLLAG